ncbi:MAG: RHS repeat protein, partial [Planctomycetes bacterium]|nr:RHS repeat protein [Planctomycetota bacterium]
MFVLNWNDGLVMFPGVREYEIPAFSMNRTIDLRAQVYGATVQSYSWDLSQASNAGCAIGQNTYRLQFGWSVASPGTSETTNTITVAATMTDSTTQSLSLTFVINNQNQMTCGSMGNDTTAWPTVLAPDKVLDSQDLIAGDSTRPYAVSADSGALFATHALPAYNPGIPALGLTYSSVAAERRPIFIDRYQIPTTGGIPNTVSARLQFDGSWGPSKYYQTGSPALYNTGDILQIALQADAGSRATGRYNYTLETTANYTGSSSTTSVSGSTSLINEESSPFGEGWTLNLAPSPLGGEGRGEGLFNRLHLVTGGIILNLGAGNPGAPGWFAGSGPSYTTPPGDFSTLVRNMDGTYTRTLKDGTKENFNSAGMQSSFVDRNNNTIAFAYIDADSDGAVDELSTITDANGLVTTLAYPGTCGAGVSPARVCTITDPASRVTSFQYNTQGQLTQATDPDGAVWTFGYDTASGRMISMTDPRSQITSFTYNFAGRVTTATRPDSTTEQLKALQLQSLCDSGECTQGQPGTALLAAGAVADYTDPRGNAWDHRLDWWGFGT